jgi:hypothetical protein
MIRRAHAIFGSMYCLGALLIGYVAWRFLKWPMWTVIAFGVVSLLTFVARYYRIWNHLDVGVVVMDDRHARVINQDEQFDLDISEVQEIVVTGIPRKWGLGINDSVVAIRVYGGALFPVEASLYLRALNRKESRNALVGEVNNLLEHAR